MTTRFIVYLILLLSVFVTGIWGFKKVSKPYGLLTFLIGITFISECVSRILILTIKSSIPVYHFLAPIEFLALSGVFFYLFTSKSTKQVIIWIAVIMFIISVLDTLFYETLFVFPAKYLLLSNFFYLLYCLLGFKQMLLSPIQVTLYKQSFFWLNTALLIYTCTIFLNFGLHDYLINIKVGTVLLNTIIYIVNIIFYTLLGVAIITDKQRKI